MLEVLNLNDKQTINVDSSTGWILKYRSQFGRDILPELMPILEAVTNFMIEALKGMPITDKGELDVEKVFDAIDQDTISDALITISGFEISTIIQIVWAMAKQADKDTEPPEVWADSLESFPLDEIVPKVFKMLMSSLSTSKNWKRLQGMVKKKSPSKKSSLEQVSED